MTIKELHLNMKTMTTIYCHQTLFYCILQQYTNNYVITAAGFEPFEKVLSSGGEH